MSAPNSPLSEIDVIAAVAELAELSRELRFWHSRVLADRLDAIIAHRFGYTVEFLDEEKASA